MVVFVPFYVPIASALTAKELSSNMTSKEKFIHVSGVVDGLAFARWLADDKNPAGMNCITDWFYKSKTEEVWTQILDWFEKHPDQQVSALTYALIRSECGE